MAYEIVITKHAEEELERFIQYLLFELQNEQAAQNVIDDFERTIEKLKIVAGSLKLCNNLKLKRLKYRRINMDSHRYFLLYRLVGNTVFVDMIFHELQDYENIVR